MMEAIVFAIAVMEKNMGEEKNNQNKRELVQSVEMFILVAIVFAKIVLIKEDDEFLSLICNYINRKKRIALS